MKKVEKMVMAEMRKIYSEKSIDHAMNPRNVGRLREADGSAKITGPCGDTMEIYLKVSDDRIVDVRFWTDGCGSSIACGSVITELVKDKKSSEAEKIDSRSILEALDGLPDSDAHCSKLTSDTLQAAIRSYNNQKNTKTNAKLGRAYQIQNKRSVFSKRRPSSA